MRKEILALGAASLAIVGSVSTAQATTLSGGQFSGLATTNAAAVVRRQIQEALLRLPAPTTSAAAEWPNSMTRRWLPFPAGTWHDVLGYSKQPPGDLPGISFNLATSSNGGNNQYAYWNVELVNPNNGQTVTINAYGINTLGANPFNSGSSTHASTGYATNTVGGGLSSGTNLGLSFGALWTTDAGVSVDGLALGSWNVASLTISVGGWDSSDTTTDTINSVTLPGTAVATPLPAALPLFAAGLSLFGGAGFWRKRRRDKVSAG